MNKNPVKLDRELQYLMDTIISKIDNKIDNKIDALDNKLSKRMDNLDKRFNKLEKEMNKKFREVDRRFNEVDKRLYNLEENVKNINNWKNKQDKEILENETKIAVYNYIKNHIKEFFIIDASELIPKEISEFDGNTITEFDGIYILTNDHLYKDKFINKNEKFDYIINKNEYNSEYENYQLKKQNKNKTNLYFLLIVETKQHLTSTEYNKKIKQIETLKSYLKKYKNNEIVRRKDLQNINFELFDDEIGLFIGGPIVDKYPIKKIKEKKENIRNKTKISEFDKSLLFNIIKINGKRFEMNS